MENEKTPKPIYTTTVRHVEKTQPEIVEVHVTHVRPAQVEYIKVPIHKVEPATLQQTYQPQVGDYRIAKGATDEGQRLVWQFDDGGEWVLVATVTDMEASELVVEKAFLGDDENYEYWR